MLDEGENDTNFLSKLVTGTNHEFTHTIPKRKYSPHNGKLGMSPLSKERQHGKISHEINVDLLF